MRSTSRRHRGAGSAEHHRGERRLRHDDRRSRKRGNTDDTTPTLTGTAEANAIVTVLDGATVLGTTTASAGAPEYTRLRCHRRHNFTVTATDVAAMRACVRRVRRDNHADVVPVTQDITATATRTR